MKRFLSRFFAAPILAVLTIGPATGQDSPGPAAKKTFTHIPLEDADVLNNLVQKAIADFQSNDFEAALNQLQQAEEMQPNSPMILNLIGAVRTKQKNYDEAEKKFLEALALEPRFFPAKFNLGEIKFLRKDYANSLSYFKTLKLDYPQEELLDFKIVLAQLMLESQADAERTIGRMKFPGNSPAWYYANAAYFFKAGDKSEGMKYVQTARKIFKDQTSLYDESLQDSGLLSKS